MSAKCKHEWVRRSAWIEGKRSSDPVSTCHCGAVRSGYAKSLERDLRWLLRLEGTQHLLPATEKRKRALRRKYLGGDRG